MYVTVAQRYSRVGEGFDAKLFFSEALRGHTFPPGDWL